MKSYHENKVCKKICNIDTTSYYQYKVYEKICNIDRKSYYQYKVYEQICNIVVILVQSNCEKINYVLQRED